MKQSLVLICSILFMTFAFRIQAQLGINILYQQNDYMVWNEVLDAIEPGTGHDIFGKSLRVGLDYGFDSRSYRISFFPEGFYKKSGTSYQKITGETSEKEYQFDLQQYGINFKTHIYPLDLLSKKSMQCPSFYHGSDVFTKGWYILVSPELVYSLKKGRNLRSFSGIEPDDVIDQSNIVFNFGIGTGLDIGITKNLSISPNIMYLFSIGEKWEGFSENGFNQPAYNDPTGVSTLSAGIRLGIWF